QTAKSRGAPGVDAGGDAETANLRAHPLTTGRFSLLPLEQFGSSVQRLFHERTRNIRALASRIGRTEWRFAFRSVDPVEGDEIDPQFPRGLRQNRLHQHD